MPQPNPYIVGRQSEVKRFAALLSGRVPHWLLNIYGPGGIGKTVVGQKIAAYAAQEDVPLAFVDGIRPDLTPDRVLYAVSQSLKEHARIAAALGAFERAFEEYLSVQEVLRRGGGMAALFDVVGSVKDPAGLAEILSTAGQSVTQAVRDRVSNRFALERYLRGVEKALTEDFCDGLGTVLASRGPVALLLDTYEEMEGLDDWMCRTFIPALPEGVRVVILGRNALARVNFDWSDYGPSLASMELPELSEPDAKAFLVHHGLRDAGALDEVVRFTGGYPLLLVLVVHLAREAGGWDHVGHLDSAADRDYVATQLLERILREERAHEVREFLEKGVVARWFDPEVVSVVLGIDAAEGRAIYDKLRRHSFVERHPYGLKFHDKIRELLLTRLKFNAPAYDGVVKRLMAYYASKAGIEEPVQPAGISGAPKYEVHIHSASEIAIGDHASASMTSQPRDDQDPHQPA